jgi:hypothetical protein
MEANSSEETVEILKIRSYLDTWVKIESDYRSALNNVEKLESALSTAKDFRDSNLKLLDVLKNLIEEINPEIASTLTLNSANREAHTEFNINIHSSHNSVAETNKRIRFGLREKLPQWIQEAGGVLTIEGIKKVVDEKSGFDVNIGTIRNRLTDLTKEGVLRREKHSDGEVLYVLLKSVAKNDNQ